ncbi:hypothetical protein V8D89_002305 [Ganoderma adspersum]
MTLSFEQQRNLVGPCAGTKICDDITAHNQMRAETVSAAADVGMCTLDAAPPELRQAADLQADLLNIALVGNARNTAFPFMQMNVVSTQPTGKGDQKIKEELGKFGGRHVDGYDSDAGVTCMVTDSDIDEDSEEWGYFVICDLEITIELRGFCIICFCGLCYHGGFAPTAKKRHVPKPWSYRYTIPWKYRSDDTQARNEAIQDHKSFALSHRKFIPKALLLWEGHCGALHHSSSTLSIKSYSTNLHASGHSTAQALAEANVLTGTSTVDRLRARKSQMSHVLYRSVLAIPLKDNSNEWSSTSDDKDDNLPVVIQHKNPREKGKGKDREDLPVELSDDNGMDIDNVEPTATVPFQGRYDMRKHKRYTSSDEMVFLMSDDEPGVIVLGFNTFLQSLTAEALSEQLSMFTRATQKVDLAAQGALPTDTQHLDSLIHDYSSASSSTPRFIYTDIFSLRIVFKHCAAMLANGVAWQWLYHDCAMRHDALCLCDTIDWLEMLVCDIHKVAHLDGLADLMRMEVINILTQWLHFPTTTRRLAAHFIVHLVQITGNIDVLLFKSVWMAHQNIKAIILDTR